MSDQMEEVCWDGWRKLRFKNSLKKILRQIKETNLLQDDVNISLYIYFSKVEKQKFNGTKDIRDWKLEVKQKIFEKGFTNSNFQSQVATTLNITFP
jgi:hypothetical protein